MEYRSEELKVETVPICPHLSGGCMYMRMNDILKDYMSIAYKFFKSRLSEYL